MRLTSSSRGTSLRPEARRSVWALVLRLLGLVIGLFTAAVISRSLGVADFGTFALGLTLLGAVGQLSDSGMVQAVSAEVSRDPSRMREFGTSAVIVRLAIAVLAVAVIVIASTVWLPGDEGRVVSLFALCAPMGSLTVLTGITNAEIKPQVAASLAVLQGALWLVVSLFVAAWCPSPVHYAGGYLLLSLIQAGATAVYFWRRRMFGRPSIAAQRILLVRAAPAALLGLLVTAYYRLDTVILYAFAGSQETGLYAAAYRFLDVAQIVPGLLVVPLLPILSGVTINPERRRALALGIIRIAMFVGIAGAVALSAGAPLLVGLIYGAEYDEAVWPLRILGLAYIGVVLGYVGTTAVFALGKTWSQIPRVALIAAVSIALQVPVIEAYGAMGAAAVTALTEAAVALNGLWLVREYLGLRLRALRLPVGLLVAAAGVAGPAMVSNTWLALMIGVGLILAMVPLGLVRREDLAMALRRS